MKTLITTELLRRLPPGPVDIYDTKQRGLVLRVRANGRATYVVNLRRGVKHTLGGADVVTPLAAREAAQAVLGKAATDRALGLDPDAERQRRHTAAQAPITYAAFLTDRFEPWALEHLKRGKELVQRHRAVFVDLLGRKLSDLTPWTFEKWRTERLKSVHGRRPRPDTLNSHLTMLKALLAKAVEWRVLATHPLVGVKPLQTDKTGRLRYLIPAEEHRLRAALDARDRARQDRRDQANAWRRERGYQEWPTEATPLTTIALVALNTGLRKGEILGLRRTDLDFTQTLLTVRGTGAKNAQTRYVPMNAECVHVLQTWLAASEDPGPFVFPGRHEDGGPLDDIKGAWRPVIRAAKIPHFTFHDLRHTFASKLVMAGVDLNTVRELLGHSDIKMTLRYAHLAPEHKAAAVAKLVAR